MEWTVHATVGGEPRAIAFDGEALTLAGEGWSPPDNAFGWTVPGERVPRLTFSLVGEGPTYDLLVRQGKKKLVVSGLHITHEVFAWLPQMDAACLLTGDSGYDTAERIVVLGLEPVREALAAGKDRIDGDALSHIRIVGASHGLDFEADSIMLISSDGGNDLGVAWNVPRTNPPESRLKVISFPQWVEGIALDRAQVASSDTLEFDNLWMSTALIRTWEDGSHAIDVIGTTRRRNDFCVAIQSARSDTPLPMAQSLRSPSRTQQDFPDAELRNAGALQKALLFRGGEQAIMTIETPTRKRKLLVMELGDDPGCFEMEMDKIPYLKAVAVGGSAAADGEEEDEAEDFELDGDAIPLSAGEVREVELGEQGDVPEPDVYVVQGDVAGSRLRWWLGRHDGEWTLYLLSETDVAVMVE